MKTNCAWNNKNDWWCSRERFHEGPCALRPRFLFHPILWWRMGRC